MDVIHAGNGPLLQPVDLQAFRLWNQQKDKGLVDKRMSEAEAVRRFIRNGDYIGTELYGTVRCPMSLVNEIVRQGIRDTARRRPGGTRAGYAPGSRAGQGDGYHLCRFGGLWRVELPAPGSGKRAGGDLRGVEQRRHRLAVQGCGDGSALSFRLRSMLGTDTLNYSAAKVVICPFTGDPICLSPALILDVGLIHVHRADKYGNCRDRRHQRFCRRDGARFQDADRQH